MNYEKEVKKVYPDAWAEQIPIYDCHVIRMTKERYLNPRISSIGDRTKSAAWENAYLTLKQQGKL